MERSGRFILFLAAAALASPLFFKGHGPSRNDGSMAFLPFTSTGVTVRLKGEMLSQGVYSFDKEVGAASVIKMTVPVPPSKMPDKVLPDTQLKNGDILEISSGLTQLSEFCLKKMNARERMLLGIPLHPDQMDYDDWGCLPGIGPALAKRLLEDRQINGEFNSIEAVQRVPGIGEKKFSSIKKFFK